MSNVKFPRLLIVIPARLKSARLPKKLLLELHGKPLLYWVVKRVLDTRLADLVVATDSLKIQAMCETFGFPVCMTSTECMNGTERVFEVASKFKDNYELFMNVQGDEPLLNVEIIETLMTSIGTNDHAFKIATSSISSAAPNNPSEVKVAISQGGRVRYASRSLVPFNRDEYPQFHKIHGVYLYSFATLEKYVESPEGPLEACEKIEQLRCIENDIPLYAVVTPHTLNSVDTQIDFDFYQNLDPRNFYSD